jgi:hypothetical protein
MPAHLSYPQSPSDLDFSYVTVVRAVTAHVAQVTITIDVGGEDTRTIRRTTQPVPSIKAHRPRRAPRIARAPVRHVVGPVKHRVGLDIAPPSGAASENRAARTAGESHTGPPAHPLRWFTRCIRAGTRDA